MQVTTTNSQDEALNDLLASLGDTDEILLAAEPADEPAVVLNDAALPDLSSLDALDLGGLDLVAEVIAPAPIVAATAADLEAIDAAGDMVNMDAMPIPDAALVVAEAAPVTEAAAPAKKAATPRKHYANKVERLQDKFGANLGDYMVLELADAALTGDDLKAKQEATVEVIKTAGVKVQGRITFILEFIAGKTENLNGVIATAFKLVKTEGHITSGDAGNLQAALVASGKKLTTARAMSNNTIAAMRALKAIVRGEDGKYVLNPQSLVAAKLTPMLGL